MKQLRVVVIGAGVVGTATAEAFWHKGHHVTVVDGNREAGMSTSAGNAGQLCGPFCLPFGSPGFLVDFLSRTFSGSGVGVSLLDAGRYASWLLRFSRQCRQASHRENSAAMLNLAYESVAALEGLLARHAIEFDYRKDCGKLYLYASPSALTSESQLIKLRREAGFDVRVLSKGECLDIEPLLRHSGPEFAGGVYAPDSSVGDCALFTRGLSHSLREKGVVFRYETRARGLLHEQGRVQGVQVDGDPIEADIVVLATASETGKLLPRALRSQYPIAPIKGYSVTLPLTGEGPRGTITDAKRAAAFSTLGGRFRITGGAYFSSSTSVPRSEAQRLLDVARSWFPDAAEYDAALDEGWAGLRPVTPASVPYIGETGVPGLMINTGHGAFGWTCAAASARRLVSCLEE